jgi:suppressor for copper-sensitivity B
MKNTLKTFLTLATLIITILMPAIASALESPWQDSSVKKEGSIRLISAGHTDEGEIVSGLHIKFTGKWKTYWKFVGDSGMSVTPDFTASENIKGVELVWPVPTRHLFFDLEGWGYDKEVILPFAVGVVDATKPAKLVANVKWAVCDEDCIFVENKLELEVPSGYKNSVNLALIDSYILKSPENIADSDIKLEKLSASDKTILAEFSSPKNFADDVDLFITEDSKNFRFPKPAITRLEDGKKLSIATNYEVLLKNQTLEGKTVKFTLRNGDAGVEGEYKIDKLEVGSWKLEEKNEDKSLQTSNFQLQTTLLQAIIAALIGGLILNIMPCVLPVIMLKIFGVIKHGSSDKKFIRKSFSYTVAGIIFSFMMIAAFVVILKSLGHTVGWGIQFQQPVFLIFMSALLTLFAANQFGWFEINLHTKISDKINDKLNKAGNATPLGNFLTGAFATLLATPCTAPYLATAISFAFAAKALTIFIVFFFMGVGLALPYILIMISPSFVKIFPKPGRWIGFVRVILGIFLILTNFWIVWIFFSNGGYNSGFMLLVCMLLLTIWLFISHRLKLDRTKTFLSVIWMVVATFGITLYLVKIEEEPEDMKDIWVQFERAQIDNYVAEGRLVFVDITADWCLTCKFNKANAIYPMKHYFDENKVIMMKGDYTMPSRTINRYLEEYKMYGIPLNVVYGPSAPKGIKLPVLLKGRDIKNAVEKAK